MVLTRRSLLLAAGAGLIAPPARASEFAYKDWHFDTDDVKGGLSDDFVRYYQTQIDMIEGLTIKPEIKAFFRGVDIKVEAMSAVARYYSRGEGPFGVSGPSGRAPGSTPIHRMLVSSTHLPPAENPILLQGVLYAYLGQRISGGRRNPELVRFFDDARRSGKFPNAAPMLESEQTFFGLCGSVILWGHATREPFTRARVREQLPRFYDWVVKEFAPDGVL
jgi:hypothetical protein